jgi:YVTN family beta-propeller protein
MPLSVEPDAPIFRAVSLSRRAVVAIPFAMLAARAANSTETSGTVFTADEIGASVSALALPAGTVRTARLAIAPHNVDIGADRKSLLLVGTPPGSAHGAGGGRLLVLDAADITRPPRAEIAIGPHPAHVVPDADGTHAYVTDSHEGVVMVVDLVAGRIVARIPVGAEPHGLRLSPDSAELFVANMRSDDVSVVDVRSRKEVARIPAGRVPVQVAFTPDGRQVFASLNGQNRVAIIDRAARRLVDTVPVGRHPVQLQVTPDGRWLYVANQGSKSEPDETVSVIDVTTRQPAVAIRSGRGAHGIAMSQDGALVFVSNIVDGSIAVLDVATQSRRAVHRVGAGPNGIAFLPSA